ncbi:glycosyltransferase [Sphingomonas sp. BN140010]|uniref:Glycosyltransferase n=1 Tax=Sphingomonas arvum TaxID=2992113 RepID=A0ABT3JC73_9SPHN|nr:glycosyltransferase [Sphingomonas sp. BN140010]MCW3796668.1 glycosyltransferase [Sphingomonas sp. BN140010]
MNSLEVDDAHSSKKFKVCIVTRTKDRGLMLARAAQSVRSQTFEDYCWVVVNDGGDEDEARAIWEGSGIARERRRFLSNAKSKGMEVASNQGIRAVESDFIVIHDDDDSWDRDFLKQTVGFLEAEEGRFYGGVVTHSVYVSELVREKEIVTLAEKPYQNQLVSLDLDTVIDRNLYPPISFLFKRSVYEQIGGFDDSLPVLGDWLFNMEFLLRANVGVIKEPLAYYHHRDSSELTAPEYRNTVVDSLALHQKYTAIVRNDFLRRNIGQSAIAFRMAVSGASPAPSDQPSHDRHAAQALPSVQLLSRGEGDLSWAISAINAKLAERRVGTLYKFRKVSPLPPNASWSTVVPLLQRLAIKVPAPNDFDEHAYLAANPDVAEEVRQGRQKSGFNHYLIHGRHEGRARTSGEYTPPPQSSAILSRQNEPISQVRPVFDSSLMTRSSHHEAGFETVLHVAHHEWHGIRQATAYCPGHKLLISAHEGLDSDDKKMLAEEITRLGINRICIQGYSSNADALVLFLRSALGPNVKFFMVSHVNTAQFDHQFEMQVIAKLLNRRRFGVLDGIGSVKPNFGNAIEGFWPGTIINYAPNIPMPQGRRSERVEVYAPLDVGWRKNLFTNVMAASMASNVDVVKTANFPNGLEDIYDLAKLRLVGYLRGRDLLDEMARSSLTLVATLAECQPMTQLESFAVGTPSLTGPLEVTEFANDPLIKLCTTTHLDNPALLARDIERIVDVVRNDPDEMNQMIASHLSARNKVASQSYADFLGL